MHVCIVSDCLFPWTKGGAERWYRVLADQLVLTGHDVTYLTREQWTPDDVPDIPGVHVVAVSKGGNLYDSDGSRLIGPALAFTRGVVAHLARHRRRYDVVHVCVIPPMVVPAAGAALLGSGTVMGVDWHEVWTPAYWRQYLGPVKGTVAAVVQFSAALGGGLAFANSVHTAERLRRLGLRGELHVMPGLVYESADTTPTLNPPEAPHLVYVGRHIPDKHVDAIPAAVVAARAKVPGLTATILGDGPSRPEVVAEVSRLNMADVISLPGFVDPEVLDTALRRATCLLFPSSREGYGLVVVEAAARGTPIVVVAGPDNSAAELVENGVNGFVVDSLEPEVLAGAVLAAHSAGADLRRSTARWFAEGADRRSVRATAQMIMTVYEQRTARGGGAGRARGPER